MVTGFFEGFFDGFFVRGFLIVGFLVEGVDPVLPSLQPSGGHSGVHPLSSAKVFFLQT
jgi:hypothetical protein